MRTQVAAGLLFAFLAVFVSWAQTPLGTAFTYQGQLKQNGQPFNGSANLVFKLYDAANAGNLIGTQTLNGVTVTGGLFTVAPDFGAGAFDGRARWLEVSVNGTPLTPRQPIAAAPYALGLAPGATIYGGANGLNSITLYHDDAFSNAIYAFQNATNGTAIYGESDVGASAQGVWGITADGIGVHGQSSGGTAGVAGENTTGYGVSGVSSVNSGVNGLSASGNGVVGISDGAPFAGSGVVGYSPSGNGVEGISADGYGVYAHSTGNDGVRGLSDSVNGNGIVGEADGGTSAYGVWGMSTQGDGVFGSSSTGVGVAAFSGSSYGILGIHDSISNVNVGPFATPGIWGDSGQGNGVMGTSGASGGAGVVGYHPANVGVLGYTNTGYGIYGVSTSGSGYAGYFQGRMTVTGTKSFQIDHPLDPENKTLTHYCAEGPEPQNIYNGIVTTDAQGFGRVQLPDYFDAINRDFRYQLTVIDDSDDFVLAKVVRPIEANEFVVRTSRPNVMVSWEVKGIRNDRWVRMYGCPVEEAKTDSQRGKYLAPEAYGLPLEMGIRVVAENTSETRSDDLAAELPPAAKDAAPLAPIQGK